MGSVFIACVGRPLYNLDDSPTYTIITHKMTNLVVAARLQDWLFKVWGTHEFYIIICVLTRLEIIFICIALLVQQTIDVHEHTYLKTLLIKW